MIPGFGPRHRTLAVGGRLRILEPDGTVRTLVGSDRLFDAADPSLSWDAQRVVFSGLVHPDSSWRIYEIGIDGTGFRQVTFSSRRIDLSQFGAGASLFERYDDFDPCYLPDGRIICASTRYPSMAVYGEVQTSNLFVVGQADSSMRRITTERNGGEEPTIDPVTGRIVYARWWLNRDRPSNITREGVTRNAAHALTDDEANIWQAISIRSDGEGMKLYAGFPRTREGMQTYKPSVAEDGRLLSVYTTSHSILSGPGHAGIRWFRPGADFEHHVIGARSDERPGDHLSAVDPVMLDDEWLLISSAEGGNDFGLSLCRIDGTGRRMIYDEKGFHDLEPEPVRPRNIPPVLEEEFPYPTDLLPPTENPSTHLKNDTFRFDCMNIFTNAPVDIPIPDAPRIAVGARIRFFMNVQRQSPGVPDPSIFLKDAPVFLTGGVHEHDLPADVPLFEQVVDVDGRVLERTDGGFAHVTGLNFDRAGSGTKCVGCHPGHSVMEVPVNGTVAEWFNLAPSASVSVSSGTTLPDGSLSEGRRLVDRRALTGGINAIWLSEEPKGGSASFSWDIPVEIRELAIHAIPAVIGEKSGLRVHESRIFLYYQNIPVHDVVVQMGDHSVTRVPITPVDADSLKIVLGDASGTLFGKKVGGLAEIEVFGRISSLNYQYYKGE